MGTRVLEMKKVSTTPDKVAAILADLVNGRNISSDMYDKYVVGVSQDGATLLIEVDDGSVYSVVVNSVK